MKEDRKRTRQRVTVRYTGCVQGVGFRFATRRIAGRFDVVGYVKNEADGTVTIIAEGKVPDVEAFLNAVKTSGVGGYIDSEEAAWGPPLNECQTFDVRF